MQIELTELHHKRFVKKNIREINVVIAKAKNMDAGLFFKPLDTDSRGLRVYSDASFVSDDNSSSQTAHLFLLCDFSNRCHVIDFSIRKSKHVVRSVMSGELCASMYALENVFVKAQKIGKLVPVQYLP